MTKEEKIEILEKGIELLEQAERLNDEIEKTFKKIGVEVCGGASTIRHFGSDYIHIYKGIKKIAAILDEKPYHPFFFGTEYKDRLAVKHGGYELFQGGEKITRGYSYK